MTDHPEQAERRHPGRDAPLPYADIRPRLQRARVFMGFALLAGLITVSALGAGGPYYAHAAAAAVAIDALVLRRSDHRAMGSFLVDAIALGAVAGAYSGVHAPMVVVLAYLLVGSVLVLSQPASVWVIALSTATFVGVSTMLSGRPMTDPLEPDLLTIAGVWFQFIVIGAAASLLLLDGAEQIRRARRRHRESLAAEKRASEMKTQFVSMVSHELRTPLTNISGFADTLADAWRDLQPEEIDEFIAIIRTEAEHLGNLVDDVLAIPRLETGRLLVDITDFALRPLAFRIADLIFPAGGEKQASVQVGGNVIVRADPNRVEQVLRNLLDNARKYGGDRVGIETFPRGESQVIVVADNGHGVPEEARDRIFEQFEQVSRGDSRTDSGVGLGLTVTRRLVEAMGGEVWYEPGFPVGARFCFSLPIGEPETAESVAAAERVGA